ncbi:MAG: hypothetical protein V4669_13615 [Pseudomonadota bacterium]
MKDDFVAVSYRIKPEARDWLREQAEKQERSANWMMNKLLQEAMANPVQKQAEQRASHE